VRRAGTGWPRCSGCWPGGADLELLQAAARRIGGRIEAVRYGSFDRLRSLCEGRADLFIEAAPAIAETLDRLQLPDLRVARPVELGSDELHLVPARAGVALFVARLLDTDTLRP
jgi:hypothetical protein